MHVQLLEQKTAIFAIANAVYVKCYASNIMTRILYYGTRKGLYCLT